MHSLYLHWLDPEVICYFPLLVFCNIHNSSFFCLSYLFSSIPFILVKSLLNFVFIFFYLLSLCYSNCHYYFIPLIFRLLSIISLYPLPLFSFYSCVLIPVIYDSLFLSFYSYAFHTKSPSIPPLIASILLFPTMFQTVLLLCLFLYVDYRR